MAYFSLPPNPEIRTPQPLSLEEKRIKYTITTAVGILEVTLHTMNKNSLNLTATTYQDTMYVAPSVYSPEPSVIAAKQREVLAAHELHDGYAMPAYEASDPVVQEARSAVHPPEQHPLTDSVTTTEQTQVVEPGSGNITRDAQSLTAQFIAANNADNSPRRVEPTA